MEKEPCKLCGVLISSYQVTKLERFQMEENDGLPAKVHNILLLIFSHAFVIFTKKVPSTEFYIKLNYCTVSI